MASFIDTHAHLNLPAFADDIAGVVNRCRENGVVVFNVGTNLETSTRAVELAKQYDDLYVIIGLHPIDTIEGFVEETATETTVTKGETFATDAFRTLAASSPKVIGIGECGFDYYRTSESCGRNDSSHMTEREKIVSAAQFRTPADSYEAQEAAFIAQIELANELGLPIMIHTRGPKPGEQSPTGRSVYADVYEVLKQYAQVPFNVHFYAGTYAEAEKFFELGGTISFTGVITFAKDYEEVVRQAPLDKIHAETDCPFVAPVPHRGKRAEPWMVTEVYKKIAAIKGLDEEVVRAQLIENARGMYKI